VRARAFITIDDLWSPSTMSKRSRSVRRLARVGAAAAAVLAVAAGSGGTAHGSPIGGHTTSGPAPAPSRSGLTVVTFGDSVPAGTACGCTPFPDLYARLLVPDGRSVNLAESGYTSADVRAQITTPTAEATVRTADVLLLMVGANDITPTLDARGDDVAYAGVAAEVQRNVTAIAATMQAVRAEPVPVIVLGYWNVAEDGDVGRAIHGDEGMVEAVSATAYVDDALRRAAAASGARYVDTTAAFKGDTGEQDPTRLLAPDGDHPNAVGHKAIAEAAYAAQAAG
jgi:acyl-CoA thioesterase-1